MVTRIIFLPIYVCAAKLVFHYFTISAILRSIIFKLQPVSVSVPVAKLVWHAYLLSITFSMLGLTFK